MIRRSSLLSPGIAIALGLGALAACSSGPEGDGARATAEDLSARARNPYGVVPLSREPIPQPTGGDVVNRAAAIRLGKAFFWDQQAGSDGQVACATCHASFGSDQRRFNTLNPGADGVFASGGVTGPDQTYTPVIVTNDDAVGTQGVVHRNFVAIDPDPKVAKDQCEDVADPVFGTARQVEFRQAPMIYGAVFFRELFWAGEANEQFNGADIWGFTGNSVNTPITKIDNAAVASQSVGPPHNKVEMACANRPLNGPNSLGSKMLARPPLQFQHVSPGDSVLGWLANPRGTGLWCGEHGCSYRDLIAEAFGPAMAANAENVFSSIWGQALMAYESTLIPDRTRYDRYAAGDSDALSKRQRAGLDVFMNKGKCAVCHAGPELSDATVSFFQAHGALNRDGGDQGFHNIGLAETDTDYGRGGIGNNGVPLSISYSDFDNWAFKTPTLRNLRLTAPYFHNGSQPTIEDVVAFYDRGGDFPANPEVSADIKPLGLTADEQASLVDFLKNALVDCRVEKHKAPFDHPELAVANGAYLPAVGAQGDGVCWMEE